MKSIDEAEAQARLDEVLEEARRQPLVIRRQGEAIAILLSMAAYERLRVGAVAARTCRGQERPPHRGHPRGRERAERGGSLLPALRIARDVRAA
jgi:hypothetical protein